MCVPVYGLSVLPGRETRPQHFYPRHQAVNIIPVIDLQKAVVVRGTAGERAR